MTIQLWLMTMLILKHVVCDWFLQSSFPYQFQNKGKYGHPGGLLHALIAVVGTFLAIKIWANTFGVVEHLPQSGYWPKLLLVLLAEFFFHYHVDWLKVNLNGWFKLRMTEDAGYWNLVGVDQTVHYLSYVAIVMAIYPYGTMLR